MWRLSIERVTPYKIVIFISLKYFCMPEATIVILDNSESSINGDYEPTRWLNQLDAAGIIIQAKCQSSHQNAVGLALSAGKHAQIICTPSNDSTKVSSYLYGVKLHGLQKLSVALQTSALALKHRLNPNLKQRIICFVASTINESIEELKLICKKLKKNDIAVDFVALGDLSEKQKQVLQVMHDTVKSERHCELVYVEPEVNLSDALFNTSILGGEGGGAPAAPMMNEAEDPELLMALQLSLQEEEQRIAAERARNPANAAQNEDEELEQRALQLSMEDENNEKKEDKKKEE